MATAYGNPGGSGDRSASVLVTQTNLRSTPDFPAVVDGTTGSSSVWFNGGVTTGLIEFWFPSRKIIDEAKFYQGGAATHGVWQWEGSNDRATWTAIGATFTLGGSSVQTITTLAGNTTGYVFYRLRQISGTTDSGPFIHEFEFKIDEAGTTSYVNPLGSGNRTSTITPSVGGGLSFSGGTVAALIDGVRTDTVWWNGSTNAGSYAQFDLGAAVVMHEARVWMSPNYAAQGDWRIEGSPDGTTWTALSATVTLGGTAFTTTRFGGFESNTTAYRYYRLAGISGSRTGSPYENEIEFMVGTAAPPAAAAVRDTQALVEVLCTELVSAVGVRVTQGFVETLWEDPNPALDATQALIEVLLASPPLGGGEVPPAPGPPIVDPQTGKALRLFVELHGKQPVTTGAPVPRPVLSAETGLRDPSTWYGGHKPARLVSITTIERELADDLRAIEVRVVIADVDRFFRTYGTWGPLTGSYCAIYVVSDDVRYAEGVPYRLFAGIVTSHTAKPGFQYEFVIQDVFGQRFARLDESPRIPPFRLSLPDFPGMDPSLDGKAAQIVLGEASDELAFLADRGPQGVVPPQRLGQVNFATLWGGTNVLADAYIWSYGALVRGGVWSVYYNDTSPVTVTSLTQSGGVATVTVPAGHGLILADTITIAEASPGAYNGTWVLTGVTATTLTFAIDPATAGSASGATLTPNRARRIKVPDSAWGVDVVTPGKPGWALTGLTTDYVDYAGHRYTPFFIRADHPLAKDVREGKILVAANLYGLAEHGDGTPPYLDSAARLWQWLLVNQLFVPYYTGEYSEVPLLDDVVNPGAGYGCIDTESVESAHAAHHARVAGGYIVGFLLGSEGKQETMRHTLSELCSGADMEQGINRHGQAMLSVEPPIGSPDAEPIAHFTDIHDIEDGQFETWVESEEYYDRVEHQYGWRYVPPRAPSGTPKEGAALPASTIPKDQQEWTSGLVVRDHAAARAFNSDKPPRVKAVENRVVRSPAVADNLEQTWLTRAVGPEPMFEGPIYFRFTTGWQGLGVTTGIPIDLGAIIAMTHTEGYGQHGYIDMVGQVRKITVDPQKARVTLEGRLLAAATPAIGPGLMTRVQAASATASGARSIAVTFATPPTIGNGVVVGVSSSYGRLPLGPGGTTGTCTDTHGNAYVFNWQSWEPLSTCSLAVYYCPTITATGGPFTITFTLPASAVGVHRFGIVAVEVGGVGAGLAPHRGVTNSGTGTVATLTPDPPLAEAFEMALLVVSAAQAAIAVSSTDPYGAWSEEAESLSLGATIPGEVDTRIVVLPLSVAQQVRWDLSATGRFAMVVAGFKAT